MEDATNLRVDSLETLIGALAKARLEFAVAGAKASDHGLSRLPDCEPDAKLAAAAVRKALKGEAPTLPERDALTLEILRATAQWNHAEGWTMQLHLNPLRNVNRRLLAAVGADAGCDVMGDERQVNGLARFLGGLDEEGRLPQTILYNLNPADNPLFAVLAGAFQGSGANLPAMCNGAARKGGSWIKRTAMRRQIDAICPTSANCPPSSAC